MQLVLRGLCTCRRVVLTWPQSIHELWISPGGSVNARYCYFFFWRKYYYCVVDYDCPVASSAALRQPLIRHGIMSVYSSRISPRSIMPHGPCGPTLHSDQATAPCRRAAWLAAFSQKLVGRARTSSHEPQQQASSSSSSSELPRRGGGRSMDSYGGAVGTSRRRRRGGLLPGAAGLPRSSSVAAPASAAVRRVAGVSFSLARQPRATTTPPRADGSNSLATHGLMDVVGVRGNDLLLPPLLPVTIWLRTTSGAAHLEICYYMIQFMPKKKKR
jgi:hypothetical protein